MLQEEFLTTAEARAFLKVSRATFDRLKKKPGFPHPVMLGPRCHRHRVSKLLALAEALGDPAAWSEDERHVGPRDGDLEHLAERPERDAGPVHAGNGSGLALPEQGQDGALVRPDRLSGGRTGGRVVNAAVDPPTGHYLPLVRPPNR